MDAYYKDVRRIARVGSSLVISIPKDILERLNLKKGDYVEVTIVPKKNLGLKYNDEN